MEALRSTPSHQTRGTTVLVTRCTRNVGLEAIRALADAGYTVIGADDRRLPLRLQSRCVREFHQLPPFESADISDALLELVNRTRPDVVIPLGISDVACEQQVELTRYSNLLAPDPDTRRLVNDKQRLSDLCGTLGIPMPRVYEVDAAKALLHSNLHAKEMPSLVVKPRGQVGGGGGVHFVRTAQALDDAVNSVQQTFGEPLITDYIPSAADDVRAVHLLFDGNSRLVGYFIVRKLCLWPPDIGLTAAAISTHETDLVERLLPLFHQLRWRGPAEAEFKIDARTSTPVLLEINPRFSGAISFPLRCGVNLAALFCEAAMGRELDVVQAPQYDAGIKYVNPSLYARVISHRIRGRGVRAALRALREDLSGKRAGTVFQLSDLRPLIGKLLLQLRELRTHKVNQPHAN